MQFEESQSGLWQISLQDSSQKLLKKSPSDFPIVWSADGKWIYVLFTEKTPNEVLKIPASGGEAKAVFTLPVDEIDGIAITPDGKRLVYAAVEKKSDVWVMEHFDAENELDSPFKLPDSTDLKQLTYLDEAVNLTRQKKYAEAETIYRKGLELNSRHSSLLNQLGWSLQNQKNYAAAKEVFQKGLNLYSEESNFYNGLGWSLNYQKKYEEAEKVFQKGLALNPRHGGLNNGIQLAALNNKNYEGAKRYHEEYLNSPLFPNAKSTIHSQLGAIGILLKDYGYAENHLREALALDSTRSQPFSQLGYLYAEQKRYAEAANLAAKALGLDSSFANYNLTAWVLVSGELDLERGLSFAQKAFALKPDAWRENLETYPYLATPEHTLGAAADRKGLIAEADNGTLFMDEIANLPIDVQAKLMRVLQEGEVRPVGSDATRKVDVRVIAASSSSLRKLVEANTFREDLYYRLHVYPVLVPSLQERADDVPLLANHFLAKFTKQQGKQAQAFHAEILDFMQQRHWAGNIRELENLVERLVTLAGPKMAILDRDLLPPDLRKELKKFETNQQDADAVKPLQESLSEFEEQLIRQALTANNWNIAKTACGLKIAEQTLRYKMGNLGIVRGQRA